MSPRASRQRRIIALVCAVLGTCAVAHAQSADDGFDPGANGNVYAVAVQPDGRILVGGAFTRLGGGGIGLTTRNRTGRLNADGSLDPGFNPGANGDVDVIVVQADGKILVGGNFTTLGGAPRNRIGRLNADGTLDTTFNPGANDVVYAMAVQPDGKILVGGLFSTLAGGGTGPTSRNRIGRLNADGSLDTSFNPGANGFVVTLTLQADGKILAGGGFTTLGGGSPGRNLRSYLGRLNPDGSLDTAFTPHADNYVYALPVQPDGSILVGGNFAKLGGGGPGRTARYYLGRLSPNGSIDPDFDPGADDTVFAVTAQPDGKILVGGAFTALGGGSRGLNVRRHLGRLNANGVLDAAFNPGANGLVAALAVQADGKILVAGSFSMLGGGGNGTSPRNRIA